MDQPSSPAGQGISALVLAVVAIVAAHETHAPAGAQARGLEEVSYTTQQAARGGPLFAEHCAPCHGTNLQGTDFGPGLTAGALLARWKNRTVGELLTLMQTTMPLNSPGGLSMPQTADTTSKTA